MSISFRLKYLLGLIPSAQKIDSAWTELFNMRNELQVIENSSELARFNELKHHVQSNDFQTKKRGIINLRFAGSPEQKILSELSNLEHSKPVRDYFKFIQSTDFTRLNKTTESSELEKYQHLKKIVESDDFIRRKKKIELLRYKDSPEYLKRHEYNLVQNSSRLKRYNTTLASDEYRLFIELEAAEKGKLKDPSRLKDPKVKIYRKFLESKALKNIKSVEQLGLPAKLERLKQEINAKSFLDQEAFLQNRARFETTPDYPQFREFSQLSNNSEIQFYFKCIKSPLYLNYKKINNSKTLSRLEELKLKAEDEGFQQRVEYLKNKNRYKLSPEFKEENEYSELEKSKIIATYHRLKKRSELAFFDQWELVLDENFGDQQLSATIWEPANYWGSKLAGCSFSQANELQAYHGLNNVVIRNKVLAIVTKAEKSEGKVWDPAIGLMPRKFEYSSAIINTGNSFRFKEGIIEAKVKFRAEKAITSAFSLTGIHPFPQIDVFRSGNQSVGLGIIDKPGSGSIKKLIQIKGLNFNHFHIFRLEVIGNLFIWKINNYEVHREQLSKNPGELFLNFIGSLHQPINGISLPHHFEIEWVRHLKKK